MPDEGGRLSFGEGDFEEKSEPIDWGAGEVSTGELLIAIGRELRENNVHLRQLRIYTGMLTLIALAGVVLFVLWLTGVFTIEFRPLR